MLKKIMLAGILVFLIAGMGFAFQNEPDGFRGLKWGDKPTDDMVYYGTSENNENTLWYMRKGDKKQIGKVRLNNIYYLFYKRELACIQIKFNGDEKDYDYLVDIFILKYGEGKEQGLFGIMGSMFDDVKAERQWKGDIAEITLFSIWNDEYSKGKLEIESIQIMNKRKTDEENEKRKVAEEDF